MSVFVHNFEVRVPERLHQLVRVASVAYPHAGESMSQLMKPQTRQFRFLRGSVAMLFENSSEKNDDEPGGFRQFVAWDSVHF